MRPSFITPDTLIEAGVAHGRQARALVALVADILAVHFDVARLDVIAPAAGDRVSNAARRTAQARVHLMAVLHTGLGWPQAFVGELTGVSRQVVSDAVRASADAREGDAALDALLDRLDEALAGGGHG